MKNKAHITSSTKITEIPAIIIGIVTALTISFLLSAGLTSIIMNGTISEMSAAPYVFVIRTVAVTIGCVIGLMLIKEKILLIAGITALGYLAVLAGIGIVLYNESFNNLISGAFSVLLGAAIACLIVLKLLKKPMHAARYRR